MSIQDKKFQLEILQMELGTIQGELIDLRSQERYKQSEINKLLNEIDNEDDEDTI